MQTATSTPPNVLAMLQAAWTTTAEPPIEILPPPLTSLDVPPRSFEPPTIERFECVPHLPPFDDYADITPDRYGRAGWTRLACRHCGRLIGYRPPS